MPFTGIADPEQLTILTTALRDYCRVAGIEQGTPAYADASWLLMSLFQSGISDPDELARALHARVRGRRSWQLS